MTIWIFTASTRSFSNPMLAMFGRSHQAISLFCENSGCMRAGLREEMIGERVSGCFLQQYRLDIEKQRRDMKGVREHWTVHWTVGSNAVGG
jgi:hypothetical protein